MPDRVNPARCLFVAAAAVAALAVGAPAVLAQQAASHEEAGLQVGIEVRRDRLSYHFDNPSSFDTPALVPHFFEQRYVADNVWIVATARYTAGVRWETSFGATPSRAATGTDHDTFFDPDGTVWVSGTTGGISIRSWRFAERAEIARLGALRILAGYRFRFDGSDFGPGDKTVTRNAVTVEATVVTTPERTTSQVHEVLGGVEWSSSVGGTWRLKLEGEVAPATVGRLLVQLPEKYPGQDLVFVAKAMAGRARVVLVRSGSRWPIEVSVDAGRTWSDSSTATLDRDLLGVRLAISHGW